MAASATRSTPTSSRACAAFRDARPNRPLAVVFGSSRVGSGFDPAAAGTPAAFNFGLPTAGPFLQGVVLRRLDRAGLTPDAVVLEVLPEFYNATLPQSLDRRMLDGARLDAGELRRAGGYGRGSSRPEWQWVGGRVLPLVRHRHEMRDALGLDPARPADPGWTGWRPFVVSPESRPAQLGLARRQYAGTHDDFRPDDGATRVLAETVGMLRGGGRGWGW